MKTNTNSYNSSNSSNNSNPHKKVLIWAYLEANHLLHSRIYLVSRVCQKDSMILDQNKLVV